jgi:hypothetical protein
MGISVAGPRSGERESQPIAPFEGVIAASWEGRYRSPPRPKSLCEIMKEKESNERD